MNANAPNTGAGYQGDGTGAPADPNAPPQPGTTPPAATPPAADPAAPPEGHPLTALFQERQGRRDDVGGLQQQLGGLQQQIQSLQQSGALAPETKPWANPHNPTEAPVEHMTAEIAHLGGRLSQAEINVTARLDGNEQQTALLDYERGALMEIQIAAADHPELGKAYAFVSQQFGKTAKATGATGKVLADTVRNNMLTAMLSGAQNGMSAPHVVAKLAMDLGYGGGAPGGKAPPPPPNVKGQEAAGQSLGGAAGSGGNTVPANAQALVGMTKAQLKADKGAGLARIKAMARGEVDLG